MTHASLPYPVYDADNHLYESEEAMTAHLPRKWQKEFCYVDVRGRKKLAIGGVKDLRYLPAESHAAFDRIVLEGTLVEQGMAGFADILSAEDVAAVHAYVIARANEDWGRD